MTRTARDDLKSLPRSREHERPTLDPASYFRRIPLAPQQMNDRLTSTQDAIVLCHLGFRTSTRSLDLIVDGLVEHPLTLSFADLCAFQRSR